MQATVTSKPPSANTSLEHHQKQLNQSSFNLKFAPYRVDDDYIFTVEQIPKALELLDLEI